MGRVSPARRRAPKPAATINTPTPAISVVDDGPVVAIPVVVDRTVALSVVAVLG